MPDAKLQARLAKLDRVVEAQKKFLHRVPDPDTRERAEGHLLELNEMRAVVEQALQEGIDRDPSLLATNVGFEKEGVWPRT